MRILHLTEALGGGIATLLSQLAVAQAGRPGVEVIIAHSLRSDSPNIEELNRLFPLPIRRIVLPMTTAISPIKDIASVLRIANLYRKLNPTVIHLHSSKAGVLGRLAAFASGNICKIYYSPHGLAFLRQDVSAWKRRFYLGIEKVAAAFGGSVIASSKSEFDIIRSKIPNASCSLVVNGIDLTNIRPRMDTSNTKVTVATSGRITYAKAPWRFRRLANIIDNEGTHFRWIGDGELRDQLMVGGRFPENLSVKGWSPDGSAVLEELAKSDIFIQASLWEGMPISLIEAQAAGLPAVVSDVIGCRDVVIDNVTGYICRSESEMVDNLSKLIRDKALRQKMGLSATKSVFERFSIGRMEEDLSRLYHGLALPLDTTEMGNH